MTIMKLTIALFIIQNIIMYCAAVKKATEETQANTLSEMGVIIIFTGALAIILAGIIQIIITII